MDRPRTSPSALRPGLPRPPAATPAESPAGATPAASPASSRAARAKASERNRERRSQHIDEPLAKLSSVGIHYPIHTPLPASRPQTSLSSGFAATPGAAAVGGARPWTTDGLAQSASYRAWTTLAAASPTPTQRYPAYQRTLRSDSPFDLPLTASGVLLQAEQKELVRTDTPPTRTSTRTPHRQPQAQQFRAGQHQPEMVPPTDLVQQVQSIATHLEARFAVLPSAGASDKILHTASAQAAIQRALACGFDSLQAIGAVIGPEGEHLTGRLASFLSAFVYTSAAEDPTAFGELARRGKTWKDQAREESRKVREMEGELQRLRTELAKTQQVVPHPPPSAASAAGSFPSALAPSSTNPAQPTITLQRFYKQLDLLAAQMLGSEQLEQTINDLRQELYRADIQAAHQTKEKVEMQRQLEVLNANLLERDRMQEEDEAAALPTEEDSPAGITRVLPMHSSAPSASASPTLQTRRHHAQRTLLLEDSEEFKALWSKYMEAREKITVLTGQLATAQRVSDSYRIRATQERGKEKADQEEKAALRQEVARLTDLLASSVRPLTPRPDWSRYPLLASASGPISEFDRRKAEEFDLLLERGGREAREGAGGDGVEKELARIAAANPPQPHGSSSSVERESPTPREIVSPRAAMVARLRRLAIPVGKDDPQAKEMKALSPRAVPSAVRATTPEVLEGHHHPSTTRPSDAPVLQIDTVDEQPTHEREEAGTKQPAGAGSAKSGAPSFPLLTPTSALSALSLLQVSPASLLRSAPTDDDPAYSSSPSSSSKLGALMTPSAVPPLQSSFFPAPPGEAGVQYTERTTGIPKDRQPQQEFDQNGLPIPHEVGQATNSRLLELHLSYREAIGARDRIRQKATRVIRALQAELRDTKDKLALAEAYVSDAAVVAIHSGGPANATNGGSGGSGESISNAPVPASSSSSPDDHRAVKRLKKYFIGLGTDADVPFYLRAAGKIRNKNFGKKECEALIKQVWHQRREYLKDPKAKPMHLSAFFHQVLQKRFGMKSLVAECTYGMVDAMERFRWDADCELFLKVLRGELHEDTWTDQCAMIDKLMALCGKLDAALHHGRVTGKVSKTSLLYTLKSLFPLKPAYDLHALSRCLNSDQPGSVVEYARLFADRNASGDQGLFAEKMRDGHLQDIEEFMIELQDRVGRVAEMDEAGQCTLFDVRAAWTSLDPQRPRGEIDQAILLAMGPEATEQPNPEAAAAAAAASTTVSPDRRSSLLASGIKWSLRIRPSSFFKSLFARTVVKRALNWDPAAKPHHTLSQGMKRASSRSSQGSLHSDEDGSGGGVAVVLTPPRSPGSIAAADRLVREQVFGKEVASGRSTSNRWSAAPAAAAGGGARGSSLVRQQSCEPPTSDGGGSGSGRKLDRAQSHRRATFVPPVSMSTATSSASSGRPADSVPPSSALSPTAGKRSAAPPALRRQPSAGTNRPAKAP